jgi:hypothetical protein
MTFANNEPRPGLRPLTEAEIIELEKALGAPVDRQYLVHWVSRSISDAVTLARLPSPRQMRAMLSRIERDGRAWLQRIEDGEAASLLATRADVPKLRVDVMEFCDCVAALSREIDALVRGHPRAPVALELFIDRMIGVAKRAKVLPSTPSRALPKRRKVMAAGTTRRKKAAPPQFFRFVKVARRLACTVIRTSSLPEAQRAAALSTLQVHSDDALNKLIVKCRGRIDNYRLTPHGLVESKIG